jgi:hypothetical protein
VRITVNRKRIPAVDPLFLHGEFTGAVQPVPPLEYEIRLANGSTSAVRVTFALLPIRDWHALTLEEKRTRGIVGGGGVSVLRAGREIAFGWYFMDGKRKQNYDDWWRVEVRFDPPLDEMMGVTHSKQGVRPTKEIHDILGPDVGGIARELSTRVRVEFAALNESSSSAARMAAAKDWRLPRVPINRNSRRALRSQLDYGIRVEDSSGAEFFEWRLKHSRLELTLNSSHPFFRTVYGPLREGDVKAGTSGVEILMLAFARAATMECAVGKGSWAAQLERWSNVLAAFLGD